MAKITNRRVVLASRPDGIPQSSHFRIVEEPTRDLATDELLVQNHFLSVEPAMRGWLADTSNYSKPINVGDTMRSLAVGQVVESKDSDYRPGDVVTGWFGWQTHAVVTAKEVQRKVLESDLPMSYALGILGLTGITAYLGLTTVGEPKAGETVVVSTAAGAVGSTVGQIAKILNCRTVGITGSATKVALCLDYFNYDIALDYSKESLAERLKEACPDGVNVYFDNTAGPISDAVRPHLAIGARIVVCGTASISMWDPPPVGPRVERQLLTKRARMQGFLTFDHPDKVESAIATLADWIRTSKLICREDILDGLEACPDAIAGLYRGENLGKRLVQLV